ncbi:MAG: hypothetical protein Q8938_13265 [Bacteroidota bacterium]|nr:hypothetical protein [Bacteroidota bacterium]
MDGQLMQFESSIRVVGTDWASAVSTGKERQHPRYAREGKVQIVSTQIENLSFTEVIEDRGPGLAKVRLSAKALAEAHTGGVFFTIALPEDEYGDGTLQLIEPAITSLTKAGPAGPGEYLRANAGGIICHAAGRDLEVRSREAGTVIVTKEAHVFRLYFPIVSGDLHKEQMADKEFTIKTSGPIDHEPVTFVLNTSQTGRAFDGFGGNFRLQNPNADPEVINYCLDNLRVAWARVEMPWRFWQPVKDSHPIDSAIAGKMNPAVLNAMDMAQRLNKKGIPLILSAWSAPSWAIEGPPKFRPGPDGVWGNPLNKVNMADIYRSIADYLYYLKKKHGVEIRLFSFNESDLGINIRLTAQEHDELIKGMGAYFAACGLKTKMLLGDNSDATTWSFIYPALEDTAARPYIGAISFHSWRGWEKETLEKWADAATKSRLPLIVAEGSIDAAAWNYPAVFEEATYAIEEINLYVRLLAICQPVSILQWQLTSDYSPLAGGGIFGNNEPLHPTQRFWNLKQLASAPKGLSAMPLSCDRPNISCAALGNPSKKSYAFHFVNRGATRDATLTGLPGKLKTLRIFRTNKEDAMKEGQPIHVIDGKASFTLSSMTYTTLQSE